MTEETEKELERIIGDLLVADDFIPSQHVVYYNVLLRYVSKVEAEARKQGFRDCVDKLQEGIRLSPAEHYKSTTDIKKALLSSLESGERGKDGI